MIQPHVVNQMTWTAVVRVPDDYGPTYDVYRWSLRRRKWVRTRNCTGFGFEQHAIEAARNISRDIQTMVDLAQTNPPPMTRSDVKAVEPQD